MAEPIEGAPEAAASAEESKLVEMAAKLDAGEGSPQIEAKEETPPVEPVKPEGEASAEVKPATRERGPDGKFLPKKAEPAAPVEGQPAAKVETPFEKERARQENLLKNFESEKKAVRDQAEALRRREQELAAHEAQNRPQATLHGYTADDYRGAANEFAKAGDHENAFKAIQAAGQVQAFEQRYFAEYEAKANDARFNSQMEKVLQEHEALRDPNSPEAKAVMSILNDYPEVYYLDNGFAKAHQLAKRLMRAESADDFETKLKAAEVELAKLREATTPAIGGPSAPAGTKKFNQMTPAEQEAWLTRRADEADQRAA